MRYMMIVKSTNEGFGFPPKALIDEITKQAEKAVKTGKMLGSGGLRPTTTGARVRLSNGKLTVTDGPFTEAKEIIGGYAQFEFNSREEAIASAVEFMELHREYWPGWEGETEVREMMDPGECAPQIEESASQREDYVSRTS